MSTVTPTASSNLIRSEFSSDPDMAEIVTMFVDEMPAKVEKLTQTFAAMQFDELRRIAHQLKGSSGGYGFSDLGKAAGSLEHCLMTHADGVATGDPVAEIRGEFERLIDMCKRVRQ